MNLTEIVEYCEMIAIYNKDISKEIARKRRLQNEQRQHFLGTNQSSDTLVPVVTILFQDGEQWNVLDPELWIKAYRKTKSGYQKQVEEAIPEALELYYEKGCTTTQSYTRACVSRTKFFEQRRKFVWMFALYAIQDKLITLDE